ncbi:MAG: TonB-dependent receptor [Gammaproteobacteria bacterium]|nr:TonB-dependent receptor [Gammaproteobacteria bacterium]
MTLTPTPPATRSSARTRWSSRSGRAGIVLDWLPQVDFTDETLVYASYSRGYKGGGINPAIDTELFPNTPVAFDPEEIDAYEIGAETQLWDNPLPADLSAFDHPLPRDLQVSKIINRTSVNENIDADIYGMEGEFLLAPNDNWLFNANISHLNTEIGDLETIDPRDPTQGRDDVTLIKDFEAAHCVLGFDGQGPASANAAFQGFLAANEVPYIPTGAATGIPTTPGVTDSAISSCAALSQIAPGFGYSFSDGVPTNVDGNQLPNSPEFTVSLGAEYTHFFGNGATLSGRLDYYWQDEFSARIFEREQDMVDAWDVWNASATYTSATGQWWARAFIQNIEDDDEITGLYATDQSSGLFMNGFFVEPRLFGLSVGVQL